MQGSTDSVVYNSPVSVTGEALRVLLGLGLDVDAERLKGVTQACLGARRESLEISINEMLAGVMFGVSDSGDMQTMRKVLELHLSAMLTGSLTPITPEQGLHFQMPLAGMGFTGALAALLFSINTTFDAVKITALQSLNMDIAAEIELIEIETGKTVFLVFGYLSGVKADEDKAERLTLTLKEETPPA